MMNKVGKEIAASSDLFKLHKIVANVIGKKCWKVAFGYGGELRLHLGARIPSENPKMGDEKKGEWRFGSCGTRWILYTLDGSVASNKRSERTLEKKAKTIEGGSLIGFSVAVPSNDLILTFSNSCLLRVAPSIDDDDGGIPYWEMFTPDHMILKYGPGKQWSCKASDVPVSP
jgi:hypothetical protein